MAKSADELERQLYLCGSKDERCRLIAARDAEIAAEAAADREWRQKYEPLVEHFVAWRTRLNTALGLDPLGSMETAVAEVERRARQEPQP